MKLKRLILKNFCQHARCNITFTAGLNGIVGHNGAGKSNILEAIKFAISGQLTRKVENYIKIDSGSDESSVMLYFTDETGTKNYRIYRRLSNPRQAILNTPEGEIRGAQAIAAYLYEDFGVDFDVLKSIQIVPQDSWVSLFRSTPSARAVMYRRMFGCEVLEQKRIALNSFIGTITAPAGLAETVKMLKDMLKEKRKQLEAYKDLPDLQTATQDMEAAKRSKSDLEQQYNAILYCDGLRRELAKIEAYLSANEPLCSAEVTYDVEAAWQKYDAARGNVFGTSIALDEIASFRHNLPKIRDVISQIRENYDKAAALSPKYDSTVSELSLDTKIEECDQKLEPLKKYKGGGCPTCGKPLSDNELQELIDKYTKEREKLSNLKAEYMNDCRTFYDALTVIHGLFFQHFYPLLEKYEENGKTRDLLDNKLREILLEPNIARTYLTFASDTAVGGRLTYSPDLLDKYINEKEAAVNQYFDDIIHLREQYIKECDAAHADYEQCKADYEQHTQLKANVNTAKEKKNEYLLYLEKFDTNGDLTADEVKGRLAVVNASINKQYDVLNNINTANNLRADIAQLQARLDTCNMRMAMDQKLIDRKSVLSGVVELLSPDRFPRYVISNWLRTLEASINNYLAAFNAEFRAEVQDNTDILCKFSNGKTLDAWALSGGQQVVLAIAWRLALHYTFAHSESCGFLTLDEPTTFLDNDNIDNLVSVMGNIKTISESNSLQVLVITHSQSLLPLFDNVIQL